MSQESPERQTFFNRRVQLKWVLMLVAALLVIMVAIVVVLVLVEHRRDDTRLKAATETTASTDVISPYDYSEMPYDTDLAELEHTAFVSILVADDQGDPTGYGLSSDLPAAQALGAAVRGAEELASEEAATITSTFADAAAAGDATTPTITFVFADNGTLTFFLDLDNGLVARGERAWRPAGDLRALVEAALAGNR